MDAIEQQESQADLFRTSSRIYMHCCDLSNLFTFTVPSLPFLRLEGLFGHFSFMDSPSERRMCILPLSEPLLQKLNGYQSPAVVDVRSSVIFEFEPEESDETSMLLLWDFDVDDVLSRTSTAQPPHVPKETLPVAPLLDIEKMPADCNCSLFPDTDGIFFKKSCEADSQLFEDEVHSSGSDDNSSTFYSDVESGTHSSYSGSDIDDDESVEHTLAFKCIGAAHEKPRQKFLEDAERKLHREQCQVKVKLRPEPENEKDKNAIAIDMDHGTGWFHVGYIASELTQYLHPLISDGKIVNTCVKHIYFRVYFARIGFYPLITITRKGRWETYVITRCQSAR